LPQTLSLEPLTLIFPSTLTLTSTWRGTALPQHSFSLTPDLAKRRLSPDACKFGQNRLDEGTDLWEIIQGSIDIIPRFRGKAMARVVKLDELIFKAIQNLKQSEKKEVMNFIEFLKIKEDNSFIDYVNRRTEEAIEAKKRGKRFISLEELQKDYA
jgi:hypothetical protein